MAWSHFFSPLNRGDRKPLKTVPPGDTVRTFFLPGVWTEWISLPASCPPFTPAPHLREAPRASGGVCKAARSPVVAAAWEGWRVCCLVGAVSSGKSRGFRSERQPFFPSCLRLKTKCRMPPLKFDPSGPVGRGVLLFLVTPLQGWKGEVLLAMWKEIRVTQPCRGRM